MIAATCALTLAAAAAGQQIHYAKHYEAASSAITANPSQKYSTWTVIATGGAITVSAWSGAAARITPEDSAGDSTLTVPANVAFTFRAPNADWLYITRTSGAAVEVYAE